MRVATMVYLLAREFILEMAEVYSHHLMGYNHGRPVERHEPSHEVGELRRQAVYHLMAYINAAQNGHGQPNGQDDAKVDIPPHLASYGVLQELLAGARRLASQSGTAISLDSPQMLQQ